MSAFAATNRMPALYANSRIASLALARRLPAVDMVGEVAERRRPGRQSGKGRRKVFFNGLRVDLIVAADAMQVAVVQLPKLVQPVRQLDIRIAAQLGECSGRLNGPKQCDVEFAEKRSSRDRHSEAPAKARTAGAPQRAAAHPALAPLPQENNFEHDLHPCVFL